MDWESLTGRYGERVLRTVRGIVRDEATALDASQEALLRIGRALDEPVRVDDPEAWVLTVARNAARDALRRKTRRREVSIGRNLVDERRPEEVLLRDESGARVSRALEALPAAVRDVLLLKFRDGRSGPEIAAALGVSLEAAWQKLSRALKLLRSKVTELP
jgi:RNA polymerase sigma-70 factor (ECF subfamily)